MRRNERTVYRLTAALIEDAHDYGIALSWPGVEPVDRGTCLDLNLLHSTAHQPYQECFGLVLYPSIEARAAYIFLHLASGHIFKNGNKRTAVLCLDAFALMNSLFLTLSNSELEGHAQYAASFKSQGDTFDQAMERTTELLRRNLVPLSFIYKINARMYRSLHKRKWILREDPCSHPDARVKQEANRRPLLAPVDSA